MARGRVLVWWTAGGDRAWLGVGFGLVGSGHGPFGDWRPRGARRSVRTPADPAPPGGPGPGHGAGPRRRRQRVRAQDRCGARSSRGGCRRQPDTARGGTPGARDHRPPSRPTVGAPASLDRGRSDQLGESGPDPAGGRAPAPSRAHAARRSALLRSTDRRRLDRRLDRGSGGVVAFRRRRRCPGAAPPRLARRARAGPRGTTKVVSRCSTAEQSTSWYATVGWRG